MERSSEAGTSCAITSPIGDFNHVREICLKVLTRADVRGVREFRLVGEGENQIVRPDVAFQAAEAALRAGENIAQNVTDSSLFSSTGTNGYYSVSLPGDTTPDYPIWEWEGTPPLAPR